MKIRQPTNNSHFVKGRLKKHGDLLGYDVMDYILQS